MFFFVLSYKIAGGCHCTPQKPSQQNILYKHPSDSWACIKWETQKTFMETKTMRIDEILQNDSISPFSNKRTKTPVKPFQPFSRFFFCVDFLLPPVVGPAHHPGSFTALTRITVDEMGVFSLSAKKNKGMEIGFATWIQSCWKVESQPATRLYAGFQLLGDDRSFSWKNCIEICFQLLFHVQEWQYVSLKKYDVALYINFHKAIFLARHFSHLWFLRCLKLQGTNRCT